MIVIRISNKILYKQEHKKSQCAIWPEKDLPALYDYKRNTEKTEHNFFIF